MGTARRRRRTSSVASRAHHTRRRAGTIAWRTNYSRTQPTWATRTRITILALCTSAARVDLYRLRPRPRAGFARPRRKGTFGASLKWAASSSTGLAAWASTKHAASRTGAVPRSAATRKRNSIWELCTTAATERRATRRAPCASGAWRRSKATSRRSATSVPRTTAARVRRATTPRRYTGGAWPRVAAARRRRSP